MSRRDELILRDYLEHIQQAIGRIQRYLADIDHTAFLANEEKQDAVIRNLEIIGEAAGNIQRHFPDFSAQYPDFPSKRPTGRAMRWPTAISRWTWMWSGKRWSAICRCLAFKSMRCFKRWPTTEGRRCYGRVRERRMTIARDLLVVAIGILAALPGHGETHASSGADRFLIDPPLTPQQRALLREMAQDQRLDSRVSSFFGITPARFANQAPDTQACFAAQYIVFRDVSRSKLPEDIRHFVSETMKRQDWCEPVVKAFTGGQTVGRSCPTMV